MNGPPFKIVIQFSQFYINTCSHHLWIGPRFVVSSCLANSYGGTGNDNPTFCENYKYRKNSMFHKIQSVRKILSFENYKYQKISMFLKFQSVGKFMSFVNIIGIVYEKSIGKFLKFF